MSEQESSNASHARRHELEVSSEEPSKSEAMLGGADGGPEPTDVSSLDKAGLANGSQRLSLKMTVNGNPQLLHVDPRTSLLDALRDHLQLTGTKKGCDHGQCGACTVHVNGRRVNACLSLAAMHDGDDVTTIEGLGQPGALHPMQQSFLEHDGYQCGYCTAGQIMSGVALLSEPCGADNAAVKESMSCNLWRCGAYSNIVAAIQQVRKA